METPLRPGDGAIKLGARLASASFLCLIVYRAIVKIFFPWAWGTGLTPEILAILIPIWTIGLSGLLLLLVGWIRNRSG